MQVRGYNVEYRYIEHNVEYKYTKHNGFGNLVG